METTTEELTGWGRTIRSVALVDQVGVADVARITAERGVIARGLGRSYGDPAQNAGGRVVRLQPGADAIMLDADAGTVTTHAGVSLDELLRFLVPRGWFVPVTPGTRFVTIGGMIASDVHGKNHHRDLTFGHHVRRLGLVLADGSHRSITPGSDPDLWWATIGGMGLTGIITEATFALIPIETASCLVETERLGSFDAVVDRMQHDDDDRHRYSVAWIDMVATGRSMGRGVLQRGDHATLEHLETHAPRRLDDPRAFQPTQRLSVPPLPNVMHRSVVHVFNRLWYRKAPTEHRGVESLTGFFHPLDGVGSWNRLYGRPGFLQYQFVVPPEALDTLRRIVERVATSGHASAVSVLKRFGAAVGAPLSFPIPGWTLTFDLPAAAPGLPSLLAELDRWVVESGGRHYLAKDAHITPETFRAGYPRLDEWRGIRRRYDPDHRWASDQARRLDLL